MICAGRITWGTMCSAKRRAWSGLAYFIAGLAYFQASASFGTSQCYHPERLCSESGQAFQIGIRSGSQEGSPGSLHERFAFESTTCDAPSLGVASALLRA